MIIFMQNVIFMLQINISLFKSYVDINSISVNAVFKKYNLKMTFHTLIQHANSLTAMIAIQRKHDIIKDEKYLMTAYDAAIVYFKTLMKHLNAEKKVNIIKTALFDSYFNEWCENIKNMLFIQKSFIL